MSAKPHGNSTWPVADVAQAVEMWNAGKSAGEIGEALKRSRNAVIGRLHRMGITDSSRPQAVRTAKPYPKDRQSTPRKPKAKAMTPAKLSEPLNLRLVDLERTSCRWPTAYIDGEHRFCGAQTCAVYCASHAAMAFQPGASKPWRRAA